MVLTDHIKLYPDFFDISTRIQFSILLIQNDLLKRFCKLFPDNYRGTYSATALLLKQARVSFSKPFSMVVSYFAAPLNPSPCIQTTDLVESDVDSIDITVTPEIWYRFQAVAREDKGVIGGLDWYKSPVVDFRASSSNREGGIISFITMVNEITNCHYL